MNDRATHDAADAAFDDVGEYLLKGLVAVVIMMMIGRYRVALPVAVMGLINIRHPHSPCPKQGVLNILGNSVAADASIHQGWSNAARSSSSPCCHCKIRRTAYQTAVFLLAGLETLFPKLFQRGADMNELGLFDTEGGRKYLCANELPRFLKAAQRSDALTAAFCALLALTGCRISEALALSPSRIDVMTGRVVFRTLKRRKVLFRAVPVPPELMISLCAIAKGRAPSEALWSWSRTTAWRRVRTVMEAAGIAGPQAMPKGLRHGYGVACAEENISMPTVQKWLGHAKLETTAIYQQAVGREEKAFARRLWRRVGAPNTN